MTENQLPANGVMSARRKLLQMNSRFKSGNGRLNLIWSAIADKMKHELIRIILDTYNA